MVNLDNRGRSCVLHFPVSMPHDRSVATSAMTFRPFCNERLRLERPVRVES